MRVLHLLQPWCPNDPLRPRPTVQRAGDAEVLLCRAIVRSLPEYEHTVLLLGGNGSERRAARLGLATTDRIAPPLNRAVFARRALGRFVVARGAFTLAQAYDGACATLLRESPVEALAPARLFALDADRGVVSHIPAGAEECALPLPPVDPADTRERSRLRGELGLAPTERAISVLADPPDAIDAAALASTAGLLNAAGTPTTCVFPHGAREVHRALAPSRLRFLTRRPLVVDAPLMAILPALDLLVHLLAPRANAEPSFRVRVLAHAALRLGVPVVTPVPGIVPRELADACVAPSDHRAVMARAVSRVLDDERRLEATRDACRRHAHQDGPPFRAAVLRAWDIVEDPRRSRRAQAPAGAFA